VNSDLAYTAFRLIFFFLFVSGALLFFLERGTAEWAITVFTFVGSLVALLTVVVVVRLGQRRP